MTISNSTSKAVQVTDASLSAYSFPFKVFKAAELAVSCIDSATRMETRLTFQKDFTVSGLNADSGGLVVLTASGRAIAGTGHKLVIRRDMDFVQHMDLRPHDVMPAETLERAFDILTMETQQLKEEIQRALVAPPDQDKAMSWNEIAGQFNQAGAAVDAANAAAAAAETSAKSAEISAGKLESGIGQGGGDIADHNADLSAHAALFGVKIRRRLVGNTTYYLRADGDDSNDGLSAATAFATLPRVLAEVNGVDGGGFAITIDIGAGNFPHHFNLGSVTGARFVIVRGVGPQTIIGRILLSGTGGERAYAPTFTEATVCACPIAIENLATADVIAQSGNISVIYKDITMLNRADWPINITGGSFAVFVGSLNFPWAGKAYSCFYVHTAAYAQLYSGLTLNFADGLEFNPNYGFIVAHSGSTVSVASNLIKNGAPTGGKYRLSSGSGIVTNVGDQILPGTLPGIKDATSWLI